MKINDDITKIINDLVWWIPVKKWRENFRDKFKIRPDQTRPDQTRPDLIFYTAIVYIFIIIQKLKNYNLHCNTNLQRSFFVA
ncbi:hypothetical protein R4K52_02200 [Brachyspira pilosicoli]|uniref:hypothetical protein n=1 Tax=Brachyspira pilosicoli TaxID=52584 RepID=UPI003003D01B